MPLPYISIDNFRAFKEKTEFEFAPITILTGTNSSGKSSLVDALRILQNYTDEIPEPDKNNFWDKILKFKEDYFNYRIPNFKDLVNYTTGRDSICFEFKCKFIGMLEMVTLFLEFKNKGEGINGILKSLKYKNEDGQEFFSMVIENNKTHLEIDFGFLHQKFEEEIKKEIEYYDAILNTQELSKMLYTFNVLPQTERINSGMDFKVFWEFYDKNKLNDFKIRFENKSFDNVLDFVEFCDENQIKYKDKFYEMENPIQILPYKLKIIHKELFCFDLLSSDKNSAFTSDKYSFPTFITNDMVEPILNCFDPYHPWNEPDKLMFKRNEHIFEPIKRIYEDEVEITKYDKIKENLKNGVPFYDKMIYYDNYEESRPNETSETEKNKERLKEILKQKLRIDIVLSDRDMASGYLNNLVMHVFRDPVDAMIYSNINEANYQHVNDINRGFLHKYFNLENIDDVGETITDLGHLFYDKFVYLNISNSIQQLTRRLGFNYIPSIRNNPDRFYTKKKEGYFENILADFYSKYHSFNDELKNFIDKYLALFGIGDRMEVKRDSGFGVYSIVIHKKEREINLMDLGYGISQVMPILLKIALIASDGKTKSVIIEEPETNLHPALQSKLADMFVEASKPPFNIQFIIETHSEYLIRNLQYLTMKAEINPEDTQIYYFYHPDDIPKGEPQVKKININEEGRISDDFGTGFFDEADKIAMSIWSMNQSQKN